MALVKALIGSIFQLETILRNLNYQFRGVRIYIKCQKLPGLTVRNNCYTIFLNVLHQQNR